MGFFNFYLSAALSLWALALALKPGAVGRWAAVALLPVAYAAHILPLIWAICVFAYIRLAEKLAARTRPFLFAAAVCGIVALRFAITTRYHTQSSIHQILEAGAIDQVWVFGIKYVAISVGLAVLWSFLLLRISHAKGIGGMVNDVSFQLCALMSLGILLLPFSIALPQQYNIAVSFITERMTLLYAVCIFAFLVKGNPPNWLQLAFVPLAVLYFSFLFVDTDALNKVEKRMEDLTAGLSAQDRVISSFEDPHSRVQLWGHNLDRVCLGRCVSYANYEPFTQQFRVRAVSQNSLVVANPLDALKFQEGGYVVKQSDLPFYQIVRCGQGASDLCLLQLKTGELTRHDLLTVTPVLWR